jgi:hypothetical protein
MKARITKKIYQNNNTYVFNKCLPLDPLRRAYIHPFRLVFYNSRLSKREDDDLSDEEMLEFECE